MAESTIPFEQTDPLRPWADAFLPSSWPGLFVTLDGMDVAGKSTQIELLREGFPEAVFVRDPGGTELGEKIRSVVLSSKSSPIVDAMLFSASRRHLLDEVILPNLMAGNLVVSDRWVHSTLVYQGLAIGDVRQFNYLLPNLRPDLSLILDLPFEAALPRLRKRGGEQNEKFEKAEFLRRVCESFSLIARGVTTHPKVSNWWLVPPASRIAADRDRGEVFQEIRSKIKEVNEAKGLTAKRFLI